MSQEADIIINGRKLTPAQSMTVRCAVTDLHALMSMENALGNGKDSQKMAEAYRDRAEEVLALLMERG